MHVYLVKFWMSQAVTLAKNQQSPGKNSSTNWFAVHLTKPSVQRGVWTEIILKCSVTTCGVMLQLEIYNHKLPWNLKIRCNLTRNSHETRGIDGATPIASGLFSIVTVSFCAYPATVSELMRGNVEKGGNNRVILKRWPQWFYFSNMNR